MGRAILVTLTICSLLDLLLLLVIDASPQFAFGCHALLSGVVFSALWLSRNLRNRPGFPSFSLLALLICILAPFIGFPVIGILLLALREAEKTDKSHERFFVGNPMRAAGFFSVPSSADSRDSHPGTPRKRIL